MALLHSGTGVAKKRDADLDAHRPEFRLDPGRMVTVLVSIVALLIVGHGLAIYIDRVLGPDAFAGSADMARLLNMDGETNVPTWYSVGALLFCAALAGLVTAAVRYEPRGDSWRWHWGVLTAVLLFLSLDEGAQIHEELSGPVVRTLNLAPEGWQFWAWIFPYTLLALVLLAVLWKFLAALPRATRAHLLVSAVVFVAGAVGMELVGRSLWTPVEVNAVYLMAVGVEEVLEMTGVIILARGLLLHLRDHIGPIQLRWGPAPARR